jgi:hypothetical protein
MSPTHTTAATTEGEVMAAIDEESGEKQFVVADVTRDNAWVAAPLSDAASLEEWN